MAEQTEVERPYIVAFSDDELFIVLETLVSEAALPDGYYRKDDEGRTAVLQRCRDAEALLQRMPNPFTDEDVGRLMTLALREMRTTHRSPVQQIVKAIPGGLHG